MILRRVLIYTGFMFLSVTNSQALESQQTFTSLSNYPDKQELKSLMASQSCQNYLKITHNGQDENPFNTDQLQVYKNGFLVDEFYKQGVYSKDHYHVMMSASKPVTATVLDAAIKAQLKHQGSVISYDTKLVEFYSLEFRQKLIQQVNEKLSKKNKTLIKLKSNDAELYAQITLRDLTKMQAGFKWDESYSNPLGDFMTALYLSGTKDIVAASLAVPMELAPGKRFNYSGGNANIIQGIISQLGKENFGISDPNQVAHKLVFSKLGIKEGFFEKDQKGSAIGSTYLHLKPEGMALLGHLYLNNGYWTSDKGTKVQLLTTEFVQNLKSVNTAVEHGSIDEKYLEYIKEEGVPSNSITWLNKDVVDDKNVVRYAQEFPSSPSDLYFLAGHNGQMILLLPSQKMVIVITGSNRSYWDKVDKIVHSATTCFSDLALAPDVIPNKLPAPAGAPKKSVIKKAKDSMIEISKNLPPALQLLISPIATGAAAKELCSCMTADILTRDLKKAIENCPGDLPKGIQKSYSIKVDFEKKQVKVKSMTHYFQRQAQMTEYGCVLEPVAD